MPEGAQQSEKLWLQREGLLPVRDLASRTTSGRSLFLSLRSRPLHRIPFRKILRLLPHAPRRAHARKLLFVLVGIVNQDAVVIVGRAFQALVSFIPLRGKRGRRLRRHPD